ncbi:carbohydrate sulfotransferase 10-like [Argopecten irradians]|uniref:carbohydrate sulfotransferase 10-like n=1 Tax=Argopecten irradians TaxID=31199 RepID=UPI0037249396
MRFYLKLTPFICVLFLSVQVLFFASRYTRTTLRLFSNDFQRSINDIWNDRVQNLRQECALPNRTYGIKDYQTKSYFIHVPKHNFTLCKVAKSGSTLWSILVLALENGQEMDGGFNRRRSLIHGEIHKKLIILDSHPDTPFSTRNILVSRDPYTRLYSAFVDRCFLLRTPNDVPGFVEAVRRGDYMTKVGKCGYIIHFHDFVDKVTTDGLKGGHIDPHYCPVYKMCRVCDVNYDVVMKQETLNRDTKHILHQFNISNEMRTTLLDTIRGSSTEKMIEGLIDELMFDNGKMNWMKKHCKSSVAFAVRIWGAFKLQGYIRPYRKFPYSKFEKLKNYDTQSIVNIFLEEITTNPLSPTERSAQRRQSLLSAYKDMPKRIVANIQAMYKMDFLTFGYDINPPSQ